MWGPEKVGCGRKDTCLFCLDLLWRFRVCHCAVYNCFDSKSRQSHLSNFSPRFVLSARITFPYFKNRARSEFKPDGGICSSTSYRAGHGYDFKIPIFTKPCIQFLWGLCWRVRPFIVFQWQSELANFEVYPGSKYVPVILWNLNHTTHCSCLLLKIF